MAGNDRTFRTSTPAANRAEVQGLGVGRREMDAQQSPSREQHATDPQRLEPFKPGAAGERRGAPETRAFDRKGADARAGDLGVGTPAGVDVHDLGQDDSPEADWGEEANERLTHSASHTRRPVKTEAERGQGAKTRRANKDIVSRRS